jgi:hypothetical protein
VAPLSDICTPGLAAGGQKPPFIHDWQIIHNEKRDAIQVLNFTLSLAFRASGHCCSHFVNFEVLPGKGTGVTIVSLLLQSPKALVNMWGLFFQRASSCKQFHHFSLEQNPRVLEMHCMVTNNHSRVRLRSKIPKWHLWVESQLVTDG